MIMKQKKMNYKYKKLRLKIIFQDLSKKLIFKY